MKTKKRFFLYSVLVILCSYYTWNKTSVLVSDIKYHNTNHAPSINGKSMAESADGYFTCITDSKLCYYVSNDFVQKNCNCRICNERKSLLIKALNAMNITKDNKLVMKHKESIVSDFGITMASN